MTEVMYAAPGSWYNRTMQDFAAWLHDLSAKPLPGGVSAAALAAAMGAALVAKAMRASLKRLDPGPEARATMQTALDLACRQQQALVDLAQADEAAYRALLKTGVLKTRVRAATGPSQSEAWRRVTETPICVAEACHLLLSCLPGLGALCWPVVEPDLVIAGWLLDAGRRTGLLAAESNLPALAQDPALAPLQARIDALRPALMPEAPFAGVHELATKG